MRLRLLLEGPERLRGAAREWILDAGSVVVGRGEEADWVIPDPERVISKSHCRIEADAGTFLLTDMSTNGVSVNGKAIAHGRAEPLENGDLLGLGDVLLRVEIGKGDVNAEPSVPVNGSLARPYNQGPFSAEGSSQAVSVAPAVANARSHAASSRSPVLQDWWNPDAAGGREAGLKAVDISGGNVKATIADIQGAAQPLASPKGGAAGLLAMSGGIDIEAFARAVEMAVRVLSEGERQTFENRLYELLRGESSR